MPGLTKYVHDPLYRNSWMLMLNTGVNTLFTYIFWLIAGHMTSTDHIGLTTEALSAGAMIVAVSRLGMDDSLTRFFPQSKNPDGFYNALIVIMLLVTIVVFLGFFIGLPYISSSLLFLNKSYQYELQLHCSGCHTI